MSPTDLFPPSLPGPSKTEAQTGEWNGIEPSPASLGAQPPLPARTGCTSRDDHPGLVPLRPRPDCSGSLSSNTMEPTWSPTPYRCTPASTRRHQRCSQDSDDNSPNELALRPRAGPSSTRRLRSTVRPNSVSTALAWISGDDRLDRVGVARRSATTGHADDEMRRSRPTPPRFGTQDGDGRGYTSHLRPHGVMCARSR